MDRFIMNLISLIPSLLLIGIAVFVIVKFYFMFKKGLKDIADAIKGSGNINTEDKSA